MTRQPREWQHSACRTSSIDYWPRLFDYSSFLHGKAGGDRPDKRPCGRVERISRREWRARPQTGQLIYSTYADQSGVRPERPAQQMPKSSRNPIPGYITATTHIQADGEAELTQYHAGKSA